mmetsp:Transcript_42180/g.126163  ORF Transcript_42180/g.126163 Transcript_42180/m.126163 type:complete len:241 (+) Transcript_42180:783-1505(+)
MLLGLEERVEVPERALYPLVRRHLLEAHQQEDVADLRPDLHEGVQAAARAARAARVGEVEGLEGALFPRSLQDHLGGELRQRLASSQGELLRLAHAEGRGAGGCDQLPLLQGLHGLLAEALQGPQARLRLVDDGVAGGRKRLGLLVQGDPAVLHRDAHADLARVAQRGLHRVLGHGPLALDKIEDLHLRAPGLAVLLALGRQLPALPLHRRRGDPLVRLQGLEDPHEGQVVPAPRGRQGA